jgi:hypothetical protein
MFENCAEHSPLSCEEADMTEVVHEGLTDDNAEQFLADLKAEQPKLINGPADRVGINRDEFLDSRVAVFIVTLPKGMAPDAARVFKREVSASLEVICRDAQMAIDSLEIDAQYEIGRTR